ncbi:isoleucine--tRNA ligase [Candidatus Dojkabacteria bacterium]|nr:isoleucine--tRNA ligase [Candidatus Dojkabacteria bacterium]
MKKIDWAKKLEQMNSVNTVQSELDTFKMWEENDILRKSIDQRPDDNPFTFYDGPITANNKPHYGHALTMVIKDTVPRYWTMKGYKVKRSLGWDCQGIPVEYEVEKKLGFEHKKDIEDYGVEKFNQLCRESVEIHQKDILDLTKRMGRMVNSDEEFATMDAQYIESVWWSLKELYNKDLLYQGFKVVPYSTRAGSTLSNSEVALGGYKDIVDPAVTIKFKVVGSENRYFLAWTTTPWTLPGNLLLAVMNDADYVEVEHEGVNLILARDLLEKVLGEGKKVVKEYKGSDLVGMEYEPLFPYYKDRKEQGAFKVVHADHVTLEDGTGIVHQAPYGEEDFLLMNGMGIKMFDYLDDTGNFTDQVKEYEGLFYKKANKVIMENLRSRELLFASSDLTHRMPMCWRTDTPLIYKPVKSWYVKVTAIVDNMVKENNEINWVPSHIKSGRFGKWLEGARDWALTRKRYWGTPLPVWECAKCDHVEVLGSFAEIKEKSGVEITDPHKPFIDEVNYKCSECGGEMSRVPDVIDVWYDSGAMPFARFHYPFENKEMFEKKFPAQYIAEGIDQTRGWFYTLHVLGSALFDSKAFQNVIVNGLVLAKDGMKMSKSKRNYTDVNTVLDVFGADLLRLYFLNSPIVRANDVAFDEKYLKEVNASFILPLWNSVKYFVNYANVHNFSDFKDAEPKVEHLMDRWVFLRFKELVSQVRGHMEKYNLQKSTAPLFAFIDELSRWYIRGSRDRFVDGDLNAFNTLYYILLSFSKVLAPFAPFISERIYQVLKDTDNSLLESVHLTNYPEFPELTEKERMEVKSMENVRILSGLGQSLRVEHGLKLRQPLEKFSVSGADFSKEYLDILLNELNVKEHVKNVESGKGWVTSEDGGLKLSLYTTISDELKAEGLYREFVRAMQNARKEAGLMVGERVGVNVYSDQIEALDVLRSNLEILKTDVTVSDVNILEAKDESMVSLNVDGYTLHLKFVK